MFFVMFFVGTVLHIIYSDPVCFLVTEYLRVDPVQLQHQSVNQFSVHPLVRAQELGVPLELLMVIVNV